MILQAAATRHAISPTGNRAVALITVRRRHYYACLHAQIQRGAQVLVIAFAFTSILLPLVFGALLEHAAGTHSAMWAAAISLAALQALGVGWVVLQKPAITSEHYEHYFRALPLGFRQKTVINTRILIEANAILGFLWSAGLAVIFIETGAPHPRLVFLLRIAAITVSVLAMQYIWLWYRSRTLVLASILAFDAALVWALRASANAGTAEVAAACLLLAASIAAATLLVCAHSSACVAAFARRAWPTKLHYFARHRETHDPQLRSRPAVMLAVFYRGALVHALRGELTLCALAALAACTAALLLSTLHAGDAWALVFWFAGAVLSANALASLAGPIRKMHAAARPYFGALPLDATSVRRADATVLCALAVIVAAACASAGSFILPALAGGWFAGMGAALIAGVGQLAAGIHFPRQVVVLTFLLDVAIVAAFGWLWS